MQVRCQIGKAPLRELSLALTNFFLTLHASLFCSSSEDHYYIKLTKKQKINRLKKKKKGGKGAEEAVQEGEVYRHLQRGGAAWPPPLGPHTSPPPRPTLPPTQPFALGFLPSS